MWGSPGNSCSDQAYGLKQEQADDSKLGLGRPIDFTTMYLQYPYLGMLVLFRNKLKVIMRLTPWLVSALGACFFTLLSIGLIPLIRPRVRFEPLEFTMNLLGSLSTHVQVALAVTIGLASIPGHVPRQGTAHLILRRCAKQSSELRLDNAP